MIDGTPAIFLQHLGRPAAELFLARRVFTGCWLVFSGVCRAAEEEEVGSPVQAGPTEVGGTRCVPKALPGRQRGTGSGILGGWMRWGGHVGCFW